MELPEEISTLQVFLLINYSFSNMWQVWEGSVITCEYLHSNWIGRVSAKWGHTVKYEDMAL